MKTLVIHPADHSTDFLKAIYAGKGFTVISEDLSTRDLLKAIRFHDRIIMLGHGDENGLFNLDAGEYVIKKSAVWYLRQKKCIFIWCNADVFVSKHGLKGFYTGMFISESEEAVMYCIHDFLYSQIDKSNNLFAEIMGKHLDSRDLYEKVKDEYADEKDPIISFNNQRLFYK